MFAENPCVASDDDDDDDDEVNNELFLRNGWPTKGVKPYVQQAPLLEILTIANLHSESRIWTCAELEFRLYGIKLYRSDNHCNTAPHISVKRAQNVFDGFKIFYE